MKTRLGKAIYNFQEALFKIGREDAPTAMKDIPYEWEQFGGCEFDHAKRVQVDDEEVYLVLYKAKGGTTSPPHYHESIESGIVLKGTVKIKFPDRSVFLTATQTWEIRAKEWHEFTFIEDCILAIQFHPPFPDNEGWKGIFEKSEDLHGQQFET